MRPKYRFFAYFTYLAASLILILPTSGWPQQVNQRAPDFTLPNRSGQSVSLRDFRGQVVLLDFWATWCGPCRRTMPRIQKWHEQYQNQGLKVIGVNIEGPLPRTFNFLKTGKYSFLVLFDQGNWRSQIIRLYGVRGIPQTLLIDRNGTVRYRGHPLALSEELIQQVLNEKVDE